MKYLFFLIVMSGICSFVSGQLPASRHPFVVIAHRGDHTHVPENTMAAIEDAILHGVDYVEIDLRTTKDGFLVLSHDASVGRMTGSQGKVSELTLAQIRQLVIPGGYHIPEFKDVLRICKGRVNIYLDFKEANVAQTWKQIVEAGMERQIVVYLNKPEQYGQWQQAAPDMPLMTSLPDDVHTPGQAVQFLQQKKIAVLDNVYDTTLLKAVRKLGIAVWLDVESDTEGPVVWEKMLGQGIQGMQTDHPEALMDYLSLRKASGYYNVRAFGAKGDGEALDSKAIDAAIDVAARTGGGTIYLPAGNYRCGSIRLKSHIHLLMDPGATIIAAEVNTANDYDEAEPGAHNDYQDYGHSHWHNSLIWGEDLVDVSITGPGVIWGKGLYRGNAKSKQSANKAISLLRCRNVIIRDISILHGGWFAILATGTDNLTLDNVKMDTNRDGVDIDCCKNVKVSNCMVNSPTDDAICLKSTYALDSARATENVTITNCQISGYEEGSLLDGTYRETWNKKDDRRSPTGRIKMGTESNGGFKNITISNCVFEYCEGLDLETVDGALLEDVTIDNIAMKDVISDPIFLRLGARMRGPKNAAVGALRRINISNINAYNVVAENTCTIAGIPRHPVEDVSLSHINIYYQGGGKDTVRRPLPEKEKDYPKPGMFGGCPVYGLYVRHAKDIRISDVNFHVLQEEERSPLEFDDVQGLYLRNVTAPPKKGVKPMVLTNVSGLVKAG